MYRSVGAVASVFGFKLAGVISVSDVTLTTLPVMTLWPVSGRQ